jgi:hypothetical protein
MGAVAAGVRPSGCRWPILTFRQLDCESGLAIEEAFNLLPGQQAPGLHVPRDLQERCLLDLCRVSFPTGRSINHGHAFSFNRTQCRLKQAARRFDENELINVSDTHRVPRPQNASKHVDQLQNQAEPAAGAGGQRGPDLGRAAPVGGDERSNSSGRQASQRRWRIGANKPAAVAFMGSRLATRSSRLVVPIYRAAHGRCGR